MDDVLVVLRAADLWAGRVGAIRGGWDEKVGVWGWFDGGGGGGGGGGGYQRYLDMSCGL